MSILDTDRKGRSTFICTPCKSFYDPYRRRRRPLRGATNVYCVACRLQMMRTGDYKGRVRYSCRQCHATCLDGKRLRGKGMELQCVACHGRMLRRGHTKDRERLQIYRCEDCAAPYVPERPPIIGPRPSRKQRRRQQAARLGGDLLGVIDAALPGGLWGELREELRQEMTLAALSGELDLASVGAAVTFYRRKVQRQMADPYRHVSLDAPISGDEGLTWADKLAG